MFKDKRETNQRNMNAYSENFRLLAEALRANEKQPGKLRAFLLEGLEVKEQKVSIPTHAVCDPESTVVWEKSLCRCMYFYNRMPQSRKMEGLCDRCKYPMKLKNAGNYEILDYEVPMDVEWPGTGGVDLILKRKDEETCYGVEVKPEKSDETLSRMVAEILTYGEINHYKGNIYSVETDGNRRISYKPGICFFEGSEQHTLYLEFAGIRPFSNKVQKPEETMADFRTILSYINVFLVKYDDTTFKIEMIHSADKDITAL